MVLPAELLYVPTVPAVLSLQGKHNIWPASDIYLPATQSVQELLF